LVTGDRQAAAAAMPVDFQHREQLLKQWSTLPVCHLLSRAQAITDVVLLAVATLTKVILAIILTLEWSGSWWVKLASGIRGVFDARNNNPSVTMIVSNGSTTHSSH